MDTLTRALVESMVEVFNPPGPVVEIGALQVDGDEAINLRPLFPGRAYTGCDMRPGPGVDQIEQLEALSFSNGHAGTVLCLNVLEHAWEMRRGVEELHRVTAPGGLALATTVFAFHVHGYPEDYWRFTPRAMERLFAGFDSCLYGWQGHPKMPRAVFVLGLKSRPGDLSQRAEAWRRGALARWRDRPSVLGFVGASLAGGLFGKGNFRAMRHLRDLTVCVGAEQPA